MSRLLKQIEKAAQFRIRLCCSVDEKQLDHEILSIATTKQRAKLNPHVPRTHEAPNHKIGYGSSAALERGYCFIAKTLANSIFEDMADQKRGFPPI